MTIRDALESDLPEIVAIYNATIPTRLSTADTAPVSVAVYRPTATPAVSPRSLQSL